VTEQDGIQGRQASPLPRLIIGLGNPGDNYRDTRHNIGFMVIDELARRFGLSFTKERRWSCLLAKFGEGWLMKPATFMNASGDAAAAVSRFYKISPAECLVIADDVDLPLGRLKMKLDGSPAGHNGLKSLISKLGTAAFPRLKVGIAGAQGGRPAGEQMVSHVLGDFHPDERPLVSQMVNRSADAVETSLRLGLAATMNLFNRKEESQTPN
jgi:PTH1 family peptidyl-tRNA hydrolase